MSAPWTQLNLEMIGLFVRLYSLQCFRDPASGSHLFAVECEKLFVEAMQHAKLFAVILLPKGEP